MQAADLVAVFRENPPAAKQLATLLKCQPGPSNQFQPGRDLHLPFRTAITRVLLPDFSLADRPLILRLFAEEVSCAIATGEYDNLYQLCFYLVELAQLEDCFVLYEAKFETGSWDVFHSLDRQSIAAGHEVAEALAYVQHAYAANPALAERYPRLLPELQDLLAQPDYASAAEYRAALRAYFSDLDEADEPAGTQAQPLPQASTLSSYQPRPRPWWRFW